MQDGPAVRWDKPEQFLKVVMGIPKVRVRLRCWSIKAGFTEKAEELEEPLRTVAEAIEEIRQSKTLPPLLGLLLALGNHMNAGTPKGQADGFALHDLSKTRHTKDNANAASLLEYAVHALVGGGVGGHVARMHEEVPHLKEACKVRMADVQAALARLEADAKELACAAQESGDDGGDGGDPFGTVMRGFSEGATLEVERLRALLVQVELSFKQLLVFFKVGKKLETEEVFTLLHELVAAVQAAAPKPAP